MDRPRIRVKMCGMKRAEDVAHALSLGIDAIGLIFYSNSPRSITIDNAKVLLKGLPPFLSVVAVLVNPEVAMVEQILAELPIHLLQFHGDESPAFCQQFGKPYIKAIHPQTTLQIKEEMNRYSEANALLLDTASETSKGGTGLAFNWGIIPPDLPKPYILAGGLDTSNIVEAMKLNPYAVDVSSGIEVMPGVKDHLKMSQFVKLLWGR